MPRAGGQRPLKDIYRILQPGGDVRIALPDLDFFAGLMLTPAALDGFLSAFAPSQGAD